MSLKIGVLTSTGDCANLNSAAKLVTKIAINTQLDTYHSETFKVIGLWEGWKSLSKIDPTNLASVEYWAWPLNELTIRTWGHQDGTVLGSSRTNSFNPKNNQSDRCSINLKTLELHALVITDSEDTLPIAYNLHNLDQRVINIPKTIKGDLNTTNYTFNCYIAITAITEKANYPCTPSSNHNYLFMLEIMAHYASWLDMESCEPSEAYTIIIPKYNFSVAKLAELLKKRSQANVYYDIIVISEEARIKELSKLYLSNQEDSFGHKVLSGMSEYLAQQLKITTGYETRYLVLSHIQRGSYPPTRGYLMNRYFDIAAVKFILKKDYDPIATFHNDQIASLSLKQILEYLYVVDVNKLYNPVSYNDHRSSMLPWPLQVGGGV